MAQKSEDGSPPVRFRGEAPVGGLDTDGATGYAGYAEACPHVKQSMHTHM